jgi:hypothetical protein
MSDMETLTPRTCQMCYGAKVVYYGNKDNFTEEPCECQEEAING